MPRAQALIVDSDANFRERLERLFALQGFEVQTADSLEAAGPLLSAEVDLLIHPESAAGHRALGQADTLQIPVCADPAGLRRVLDRGLVGTQIGACSREDDDVALQRLAQSAIAACELRRGNRRSSTHTRRSASVAGLAGRSAAIEDLRERLQRLVPLDESVWIEGETGVGKRWSAQYLHQLSSHGDATFIALDDSDLMSDGWEQRWLGSAAPAGRKRTVYLKDPARFSEPAQQRLAQLLDSSSMGVTCRIVSGSTVRLDRAVDEGRLPTALAAKLAAARLVVPPLRERIEDVGPLATQFIDEISSVNELSAQRLSADALDRLESYAWPGNVRELRHAIEHATILAQEEIDLPQLPRAIRDEGRRGGERGLDADLAAGESEPGQSFRDAKRVVVNAFEGRYLTALMTRQRGNVTSAARESGMLRSALQRLLRKHELRSVDFRQRPQRAASAEARSTDAESSAD